MQSHASVVVIGAGQAGLSVSSLLKLREIDHVVLERDRVAHAWRSDRWDSFCLVTPNWQCRLPGYHYPGNDPHGFMRKDEIVKYVEDYAASFEPPLKGGVDVVKVALAGDGHGFEVRTSAGDIAASQVVVAVGGYHTATLPRIAERLPEGVVSLHSSEYKNPHALPPGDVLVVGTGQSGAQIAEDLHIAGRRVHLCVGSAPRTARRYRGKDVVEWLDALGYYDLSVDEHPLKEAVRAKANHYVTGRDGGRDIDLRAFARDGMRLYGRLTDLRETALAIGGDLKQNLDRADEVSESIKNTIDRFIDQRGIAAPTEPRYVPVWEPPIEPVASIDLERSGISCVIWCMGYRSDFGFIDVPVFDGRGYPGHRRGVTSVPGLYFLGLPWLYTWGSGRFSGVARDAAHVAEKIEALHEAPRSSMERTLNPAAIGS